MKITQISSTKSQVSTPNAIDIQCSLYMVFLLLILEKW